MLQSHMGIVVGQVVTIHSTLSTSEDSDLPEVIFLDMTEDGLNAERF